MSIRQIVFDMDGTLVDTEVLYLGNMELLLSRFGKTLTRAQLTRLAGKNLIQKLELVISWCELTESVEELVALYRRIQAEVPEPDYRAYLFPDTLNVLNALKDKGIPLYLCSNSALDHVNNILTACGIDGFFRDKMTRDIAGARKPDPLPYRLLLERSGLDPSETLAVEDSTTGILSAVGAGVRVIAIRDSRFEHDLSGAVRICNSLEELLPCLEELSC